MEDKLSRLGGGNFRSLVVFGDWKNSSLAHLESPSAERVGLHVALRLAIDGEVETWLMLFIECFSDTSS